MAQMKNLQRPVGLLLLLTVITALVLWVQEPPKPIPASAPPDVFSAERALVHVQEIARAPHPPGTPEHDRARDYLVAQFQKQGFATTVQKTVGQRVESDGIRQGVVENIIAERAGRAPTGMLVLAAHYDSHLTGPGAGDDAAGVAALLEATRALGNTPGKNTLRVLITDAEEFGLLGACGYIANGNEKTPTLVLNFEARGGGGPVFMFETSEGNIALLREFADAAPYPHASSLMYALYKTLPNDTDLSVFKKGGFAGLNFAFVGRWQHYHSSLDTPEGLDLRSLQHHGASALALTRRFLMSDLATLTQAGQSDAVYFDLFGSAMFVYPVALAWPLTAAAVLAVGALFWRIRQEKDVLPALLSGFWLAAGTLLTGGAVGAGYGFLVAPYRHQVPNGDPYGVRWFEASLLLALLALLALEWGSLLRRFSGRALGLSGLLWWMLALIATTIFLPGATYLFLWPLLLTLLCLWWDRPVLGALPTLVFFTPVWHSLSLLLGFGMPVVLGVFVAFGLLPLLPALRLLGRPLLIVPPAALALAGLVCFAMGALQSGPHASTLAYLEDADNAKAQWISVLPPSDWTRRLLGENPEAVSAEKELGWYHGQVFVAPAPAHSLSAPTVTRSGKTVTITLPKRALELLIWSDQPLTQAVLEGKPLPLTEGKPLRLHYFAPPKTLDLIVEGAVGTRLRIDSYVLGLPRDVSPRPANLIPALVDTHTDTSITRRTITLR